MADHLLFETSNASEITSEPFVNRQVVYVIDQNNGNYTGQIQLDTSSLSNSGKYCSYSEAYLQIPFVITCCPTSAPGNANWLNAASYLNFAVGLKNGYYQLIHSLSVEYNNNSVIQLTPYTNFYINYKLMTSLGQQDVDKMGQSIGFYPDTAGSFRYFAGAGNANASSPNGPGVSNNCPFGYETLYPNTGGYIYSDGNSNTSAQFTLIAAATANAFAATAAGITNNLAIATQNVVINGLTYATPAIAIGQYFFTGNGITNANIYSQTQNIPYTVGGSVVGYIVIPGGQLLGTAPNAANTFNAGANAVIAYLTITGPAATTGGVISGIYTTSLPQIQQSVSVVANYGFYKRMQYCSFNPSWAAANGFSSYNAITSGAGYATTLLKNYFTFSNVNQSCLQWYVMARIRLKDVSDFFDKLPLVKGAYLRFIINTNTSSQILTLTQTTASAGNPVSYAHTITSAPTLSNGTNPLMISSGAINQGFNPVPSLTNYDSTAAGINTTLTINCGITKTTAANGTSYSHTQTACRLYVPLYQLNPTFEEQYLSLNRTKKVVYRDIYQYSVNVGAGGTFNNLLTNGIPNPKTVIIIPMLQSSANNINLTGSTVNVSPYQSPFSTEPGTTSPLIALTNFNIQIAGINQFLQNELYDFEQFVNELSPQNAINGGLVDGLVSGLIGEYDYAMSYRYYVCDVSRRLPAEDQVPKSVQIIGQNASNLPITLFVFIEFEKSIQIDLITGAKLD